jgi:hypothetical protein
VKSSVREPVNKENDNKKQAGSTGGKRGKKSTKEEILSNPALDAQVNSILSFMQENNY